MRRPSCMVLAIALTLSTPAFAAAQDEEEESEAIEEGDDEAPPDDAEPIDGPALQARLAAFVKQNPDIPVFVAGARDADYATVFDTMVLLQQAGVPKVGLMGQPAGDAR